MRLCRQWFNSFFIKKFVVLNINRIIAINMGATKTLEFTIKHNSLAKYAKALAHPARISFYNYWLKSKPVSVEI